MEDRNKHMDKVFREKLEEFQQQPPEEIWDGIKSGMGSKTRRRILIPLWQVAAGAALLITAGSLFYFVNRPYQSRMAEQILPIPQNIPTTKQSVASPAASIPYETAPEKSLNPQKTDIPVKKVPNPEMNTLKKKDFNDTEFIAGVKSQDISNDKTSPVEYNGNISTESLPVALIPTVKKDEIKRNKKPVAPSWDMLQTGADNLVQADEDQDDRLSLTAQVSPTYSYRDIGNLSVSESQQFNQSESGRISYSGGMQIGIKTTERLSIYAGVMYAQLGYNINQVGSFSSNAIASTNDIPVSPGKVNSVYAVRNSIGTISPVSNKDFIIESTGIKSDDYSYSGSVTSVVPPVVVPSGKIEQYFQYLEVPFLLRYKIIDRKLGVNLLGGMSTNILVGNHASITVDNKTSTLGTSENVRNLNYMGNIGMGFDYIIRENLLFTVEPQFKYFLNSINEGSLVNRPYMFGMFTGVRFMW
jgi:hypothetical protein